MGRNITQSTKTSVSPIAALDSFGTGQVQLFTNSGTFVVPEGITLVRARCFGGGGAGVNTSIGTSGGTSSFGVYCSATGGGGGTNVAPFFGAGGTGIGGDINRTGGNGGGSSGNPGAGGGVAGLFKNGGFGASGSGAGTGNAGGGANSAAGSKGGDGIIGKGSFTSSTAGDSFLATGDWINLSIDFLGCGGGGTGFYGPTNGGGGAGFNITIGSFGAWPGGGGGSRNANSIGGGGGGGFTIRTIIVTPGDFIVVTVGAGGTSDTAGFGAPGCVVVEY